MAIALFTDFGADLYVGQMKAVLLEHAPQVPIIDLVHDAPAFDVLAAAHLLAACLPRFPSGTVFLAIVDPGVGTDRDAVVIDCDERYIVAPDNGLASVCWARAGRARGWSIRWRPQSLSRSFHGRDLFAPVAAAIAKGPWPQERLTPKPALDVMLGGDDVWRAIYVDRYGNVCTGIRAASLTTNAVLRVGQRRIGYAEVFGATAAGATFWYENSLGLVEIAANRADAARMLDIGIGHAVCLE